MTETPTKIYYVDEIDEHCVFWLRETRESPWRIVQEIRAVKGDRVILSDVEHIVDVDLSRRRLRRGETHLWRTWDIPAYGHIPDPQIIKTARVDSPIKVSALSNLAPIADKK